MCIFQVFIKSTAANLGVANINEEIQCKLGKISYDPENPEEESTDQQIIDWDDRVKSIEWENQDTLGRHQVKRINQSEPEPTHIILEELPILSLFVIGVIDYAKADLSTDCIRFPKTNIYNQSKAEFSLTNTGKVEMSFTWDIVASAQSRILGGNFDRTSQRSPNVRLSQTGEFQISVF